MHEEGFSKPSVSFFVDIKRSCGICAFREPWKFWYGTVIHSFHSIWNYILFCCRYFIDSFRGGWARNEGLIQSSMNCIIFYHYQWCYLLLLLTQIPILLFKINFKLKRITSAILIFKRIYWSNFIGSTPNGYNWFAKAKLPSSVRSLSFLHLWYIFCIWDSVTFLCPYAIDHYLF